RVGTRECNRSMGQADGGSICLRRRVSKISDEMSASVRECARGFVAQAHAMPYRIFRPHFVPAFLAKLNPYRGSIGANSTWLSVIVFVYVTSHGFVLPTC